MKRKIKITPLILLFILISCATFTSNTYKSLYIAGSTYDVAMKSISALQAQGKITAEQRSDINKFANIYYVSYQSCVDALLIYEKVKSVDSKNKVSALFAQVIVNWGNFAAYVNRLVPNTLPSDLNLEVPK